MWLLKSSVGSNKNTAATHVMSANLVTRGTSGNGGRTDSSDTQKGNRGEPDEAECRSVGVESGVSTSRDDLGRGARDGREASLVVRDNVTDKFLDRARREASLERGRRDVAGDLIGLRDEDGVVCVMNTNS